MLVQKMIREEIRMVTGEVTVVNESGLHLRPAGVLTQTCIKFKSNIYLYNGDRKIIAKSVLNVMAAGVKQGAHLRVEVEGPDEEEAMQAVIEAISSGLGEGTQFSSADRLF
jgi:phosphocarrier protein